MKKIFTLMMMAMMAFVLTSCDDDEAIAYTLEGTWKGNMHIVSDDWYGAYYTSTYSEITFLRDPYTYSSGNGFWVDYYSNAPWDYVANHIQWTVNYGTINIYFVEEGNSMEIYDYRLYDDVFYGTIYDGYNRVEFQLTHTSSPNWGGYRWGYDGWYDRYWSRTRATDGTDKPVTRKPTRRIDPNNS